MAPSVVRDGVEFRGVSLPYPGTGRRVLAGAFFRTRASLLK